VCVIHRKIGRTSTASLVTALMLFCVLFSGCASHRGNLQPGIRSAAPEDAMHRYARMKSADSDEILSREFPEMSAIEHEMLGDAMMGQGNLQAAHSHYDKALHNEPGDSRSRLVYKQGLALMHAGQGKAAAACFEKLLAADSGFAAAHEGMGRVCMLDKALHAAKNHFIKAVSLDAGLWQSHNYLGTLYDREGQWGRAEAAYQAALAVKPREGAVLNNLGMSYLLSGRLDKAAEAFQKAIRNGFTGSKVYNNLGMALARLDRFEEAFQAFRTAGGPARAYNNLGCIHLQNGRTAEAIESFQKAMALDPMFYATAGENLKRAMAGGKNL